MIRRNLSWPQELWTAIVRAAAAEQAATGEVVSANEWIRAAVQQRLEREQQVTLEPETVAAQRVRRLYRGGRYY